MSDAEERGIFAAFIAMMLIVGAGLGFAIGYNLAYEERPIPPPPCLSILPCEPLPPPSEPPVEPPVEPPTEPCLKLHGKCGKGPKA